MDSNHQKCFRTTSFLRNPGILILFSIFSSNFVSEAQLISNNLLPTSGRGIQFRHREILNEATDTVLEWEVDPQRAPNSTISFKFSTSLVENGNEATIILLGLSRSGHVIGSDAVAVTIGDPPQLMDMYGVDNSTLAPDSVQNWKLVSSERNSSHFSFTVSRILATCDTQDVEINNDLIRIIWGFANATGNGSIHFNLEGVIRAYLLDPIVPSPNSTDVKSWRISRKFLVPPRHTSYWCTIHRGPQLPQKHHVVGFTPYFKDDLSRQHVHHKLVYRCLAPPGVDPAQIFEKYVGHPGEECYLEDRHELPTIFCTEAFMTWGVGEKSFNYPTDTGLALGDTPNEYFMFETHYDNPESRTDLLLENGLDILYTPELRAQEGSIVFVSSGIFGLYQVPPHATDFRVAGQCSPECTREMIPSGGVQLTQVDFHAHRTVRKMIVRHFRGNQELPWIQTDLNYDFSYQQKRILPNPVTILPGDHLAVECTMDTTSRNGTTVAGFATRDEMCIAWLMMNKRLPYVYCSGEYPTERTMEKYGVTNMTWDKLEQERVVNSATDPKFVGLPLSRVIDESVGEWTPEMIMELEREQLFGDHDSICPQIRDVAMLAYAYLFSDGLAPGGLIPSREIIEESRPSTRSIKTSLGDSVFTVRYPSSSTTSMYESPKTCAK